MFSTGNGTGARVRSAEMLRRSFRCAEIRQVEARRGSYALSMATDLLGRITRDPAVMGGRPCIRGLRVTVGTVVGLLASGHSIEAVLELYPYLAKEDVLAALSYAAWRSEEVEVPLGSGATDSPPS